MKRLALVIAMAAVVSAAPTQWVDRAGEATTVQILNDFAVRYEQADNDMVRGALRRDRGHALCSRLTFIQTRGAVHEWIGTVETLSSTSDGRGVLTVRIGPHATLHTINNGFSESISEFPTLLAPGSSVYRAALALKLGQTVQFSGLLFPSKVDCMVEGSITQTGSMRDPDFLFRFTDLKPAE